MPESSHEQNMGYLTQILALQELTLKNIKKCEDLAANAASPTRQLWEACAKNLQLLLEMLRMQSELIEVLEGKLEKANGSQE